MTSFKKARDTLSTDFLLVWLFCGVFATIIAIFFAYPLASSVVSAIVLVIFCYEEPKRSIEIFHQLKAVCFGIICGLEEIEESPIIKEDEDYKRPPPGRFRFAKLLLTNQVPLMANYFEQRSQ